MRIKQNVSFKGRIKVEKQINSKNKLVRYSINYLKHNVGGRNVEHELVFNEAENNLMVFTRFFPDKKAHNNYREVYGDVYSFNTLKRLDLISKEKIAQKANEINKWIKRIRGIE